MRCGRYWLCRGRHALRRGGHHANNRAVTARDPLKLEKLADGVFVYAAPYELMAPENGGAICNMGLVVGSQSAAVIDTGNSVLTGRRLLEAVRRVTDRPVRYVINTHMHPDHVLGNAAFRRGGHQLRRASQDAARAGGAHRHLYGAGAPPARPARRGHRSGAAGRAGRRAA